MIENGTWQARTHRGLESVLEEELKSAGAKYLYVSDGNIKFKADEKELYHFLLNTFVCTSVEVLLSQPLDIREADITTLTNAVPWQDVIPLESVFKVQALNNGTHKNGLRNLATELEKSISSFFKKQFGSAPKVATAEEEPEFVVLLHVENNGSCYLALEAGGEPFASRAVANSTEGGMLSPALAAGLILMSGWDKTSVFIDPFAGDGTFVLEAARIAKNRTPAFENDDFLMKRWRTFRHALWKKTREALLPEIRKDVNWINAIESRRFIFNVLQTSVRKNRLTENINLKIGNAHDIFIPSTPGVIMAAPHAKADAEILDKFVKHVKKFAGGYTLSLFTSLNNLDSLLNMKPDRVLKIDYDEREFSFMQFEIFKPVRKEFPPKQGDEKKGRYKRDGKPERKPYKSGGADRKREGGRFKGKGERTERPNRDGKSSGKRGR